MTCTHILKMNWGHYHKALNLPLPFFKLCVKSMWAMWVMWAIFG